MHYTRRATLGLLLGALGVVRGSSGGLASSSSGETLNIAASLGENEWKVMRERVFPPFEAREHCRIRAVNIEAADTLKKIEAMHRANRMSIDLMLLDNMNLAPYVEKRLVLDFPQDHPPLEPAGARSLLQ